MAAATGLHSCILLNAERAEVPAVSNSAIHCKANVQPKSTLLVVASAMIAASMWCYVNRILIPCQVADAAAHDRPRGNLSDLYPRWLGARELLLHQRDPYGADITREIQSGYYGRPLDPQKKTDPKDQQGFAYPVYVALLLAPTVKLEFSLVQEGFRWLLIFLTIVSVLCWTHFIRWNAEPSRVSIAILLTMGSLPVVQGIKLQQLSLLVAGFIALSAVFLVQRYLAAAGVLLALATIKPQLAAPLVAWLLLWTLCQWRSRQRLFWSFLCTMVLLAVGSEILLPGWIWRFRHAVHDYYQYTETRSIMTWMFGSVIGTMIAAVLVLLTFILARSLLRKNTEEAGLAAGVVLVLALTVVIVPMSPYNQVLLLPAFLILVKQGAAVWTESGVARLLLVLTCTLLCWPWIAGIGLSLANFFLPSQLVQSGWKLPFISTFVLPLFTFAALALLVARDRELSIGVPPGASVLANAGTPD